TRSGMRFRVGGRTTGRRLLMQRRRERRTVDLSLEKFRRDKSRMAWLRWRLAQRNRPWPKSSRRENRSTGDKSREENGIRHQSVATLRRVPRRKARRTSRKFLQQSRETRWRNQSANRLAEIQGW